MAKQIVSAVCIISLLCISALSAQDAPSRNITSFIIDDFASDADYTINASANVDVLAKKSFNAGAENIRTMLEFSTKQEMRDQAAAEGNCMAIKASFENKGFNWIELVPNTPIEVTGKAKELQIWILGMKYHWNLEIWVQDYTGIQHKIDFGSIYFEGWQSITRKIPWWAKQQKEQFPKDQPLRIVKIIFRADPYERADRFYVFIDQIRVLTDLYEEKIDGWDLIKQAWE